MGCASRPKALDACKENLTRGAGFRGATAAEWGVSVTRDRGASRLGI